MLDLKTKAKLISSLLIAFWGCGAVTESLVLAADWFDFRKLLMSMQRQVLLPRKTLSGAKYLLTRRSILGSDCMTFIVML